MSYYHIDGVSGGFASSDSATYEQSNSWRWLIASILLVISILVSGAAVKVLTSVEQSGVTSSHSRLASSANLQPEQAPAVLAASQEPSELQLDLEAWRAQKKLDTSFYVQSLDTGEVLADIQADKQYQMASMYKLFLLKPLAKKLPAEAWATNTITEKSYLACVHAMLAVSDNPCAEAIAGKLGWNNVHKQVQATGYKHTNLNSSEKFYSSASDTALLLDRLFHGDGYDAKTKSIALEAMAKRKSGEAVRRSCDGCSVYNKTGDLSGYKHDAAIVEKNGKYYVVVLFSSGTTWPQLSEASAIITDRL